MSFMRTNRLVLFGVVAIIIAIFPAFVPSYVSFEFTYVAAYAIAILGLIVLTGKNGQISLGHGAFLAIV
jgi:branched-chain amino acid transport system permease protein